MNDRIDQSDPIAEIITAHQYADVRGDYEVAPFFKWVSCTGCDWTQDIAGMAGWRSWVAAHANHVAEVLRASAAMNAPVADHDPASDNAEWAARIKTLLNEWALTEFPDPITATSMAADLSGLLVEADVSAHAEMLREAKRDALREARGVITQYLSTAEKWRYDRVCWAFAIMLGEIPEDSPEPLSPADEAEIASQKRAILDATLDRIAHRGE